MNSKNSLKPQDIILSTLLHTLCQFKYSARNSKTNNRKLIITFPLSNNYDGHSATIASPSMAAEVVPAMMEAVALGRKPKV